MQPPNKFAGAVSLTATLVRKRKEQPVWVNVPVVEAACPRCSQAINTSGNQLLLGQEPNYQTGTLLGRLKCSRCSSLFNEATYYFYTDRPSALAALLALSVLTDEDPNAVLKRGFTPYQIQNGVLIAEGARIGRNVRFTPPVLINKGSVIAEQCEIGPFVYLENVTIEEPGIKLVRCDVRHAIANRSLLECVIHGGYIGRE